MRLVRELRGAPIAIHVDRKSPIYDEVKSGLSVRDTVTMLPRHTCFWGGFGHVAASLEGMRWFVGTKADYAVLLTGTCFPILSQPEIGRRLAELDGASMMEHAAFPKAEWEGADRGGFNRVERFFIHIPRRKRPLGIPFWKRTLPSNLHPYGGSSYWCLSRRCVEWVLDRVDRDPGLIRFFRTTFTPDESFFQTVLLNSPLAGTIQNSTVHYTDWTGGGGSPAVIQDHHIPAIRTSGKWFARKLDDVAMMDKLAETFGTGAAARLYCGATL